VVYTKSYSRSPTRFAITQWTDATQGCEIASSISIVTVGNKVGRGRTLVDKEAATTAHNSIPSKALKKPLDFEHHEVFGGPFVLRAASLAGLLAGINQLGTRIDAWWRSETPRERRPT